jgi:hypothetical protein
VITTTTYAGITTITYADHVAHLDSMTGEGLLVLPRVADDIGSSV